jgi:hypothetical protein
MAKKIQVVSSKSKQFKIRVGKETTSLLNRFSNIDQDAKDKLLEEAVYLLSQGNDPVNTVGSKTGIAIGYVQSGKTMSFTVLTSLAIDNNFKIIVYFAGVKNNLLEQTVDRIENDLQTKKNFDLNLLRNPTVADKHHSTIQKALDLKKPVVLITILKHHTHLKNLTEIFETQEVRDALGNNGVLIIDDEADQASLDGNFRSSEIKKDRILKANLTQAKKDALIGDLQTSRTYSCILQLKDSIPNHTYIQYTATPQGPLLISVADILSPKFHKILTPGKSYTGGKVFFGEGTPANPRNPNQLIIEIPEEEVFHLKNNKLTSIPDSLVDALQVHLIGVAINIFILDKLEQGEPLSMMIHADRETDASSLFSDWVYDIMGSANDGWDQTLKKQNNDPGKKELVKLFKKNYNEAVKKIKSPPTFDAVMKVMSNVINRTNVQTITGKDQNGKIRRKESLKVDWGSHPSHIIIGAEMLNRGFTIEGLMVSYMPRNSKAKSQADTIEQRCRFFGYKRAYLDSCRVYLPQESINEYVQYVKHEELFRHYLSKNSLTSYEQTMVLDPNLNPVKNNILSPDLVTSKMQGFHQTNALQSIPGNIRIVEDFLRNNKFTDWKKYKTDYQNHRYVKVDIQSFIQFLLDFTLGNFHDTMRKTATIQYLKYQADVNKLKHAYIFEMGYKSSSIRERYIENKGENIVLNNIFSGADTISERKKNPLNYYPGDREIKLDDSICLQIHKIEPTLERLTKREQVLWASKIGKQKYMYTLGIYYPEKMANGFKAIKK